MTNARVVVPSSSSINDASVCNTIYSTYFFFTLLLHPFAPRSHCFGYPGIPLNKYDQAKLRTRINCVEILMCLEWAFGLILLRKRTIFPRFETKLFTISNMIYATVLNHIYICDLKWNFIYFLESEEIDGYVSFGNLYYIFFS